MEMRKGEKKGVAYDDSVLHGREHALDAGVHLDIGGHCFFELDGLKFLSLFSVFFRGAGDGCSGVNFGGAGDGCSGVDFGHARLASLW